MEKMTPNRYLALFVFFFAIFLYYFSSQIPKMPGNLNLVDAKFLPNILSGILLILSLFLFFEKPKNKKATAEEPFFDGTTKACFLVGLLVLCALGMQHIGFEITSICFLSFTMRFMGMKSWPMTILLPIAVTALIYVIFIKIMYVAIPSLLQGM